MMFFINENINTTKNRDEFKHKYKHNTIEKTLLIFLEVTSLNLNGDKGYTD
jgi:hypothetical protein